MTDKQRIERLERVLGTLIAWLYPDLGEVSAQKLLDMLERDEPTS